MSVIRDLYEILISNVYCLELMIKLFLIFPLSQLIINVCSKTMVYKSDGDLSIGGSCSNVVLGIELFSGEVVMSF